MHGIFKSILCVILAVLIITLSISVGYTAEQPLYGDVNDDGEIDIKDVTLMQKYITRWNTWLSNISYESLLSRTDFNMDTEVSIADAIILQRFILGTVSALPVIDDTAVIDRTISRFPTYWNDEILNTIGQVRDNRKTASDSLAEFVYLTDWHWDSNSQRSPDLVNYLTKRLDIDHVLLGGDAITYYHADKDAAIAEAYSIYDRLDPSLKVFTTLGNHDRNGSSGNRDRSSMITDEEAYDIYIQRSEDFAVTENGNPNVGYYDDAEKKLRVVQFYMSDSFYINMVEERGGTAVQEAKAWAIEKMKELPSDWTVVLLTHAYYHNHPNSDGNDVLSDINIAIKDDILQAKKEMSATLAAWFVGHVHFDYYEMLTSSDESNDEKLQIIVTQSDSRMLSNVNYGYKMRYRTTTEQALDIVQIDTQKRIINLTRCGAGVDRQYFY